MEQDARSDDMLPVLPPELAVVPKSKFSFDSLLPKPTALPLTPEQIAELANFEASLVILGPAAGQVLVCPGNQEGLDLEKKCPYAAKCPLLRVKKAPEGALCPIERTIVEERYSNWCREIGKDPTELNESERVFVSTLTWIDLQEQRCVNILSAGEAARLTQVNVTEAINYVDQNNEQKVLNLTWERVLHVSTQRLGELHEQRRMLLKDWMLTPEQKWKIAKAEGKAKGTDLGSRQSQRGDKLRKLDPTFE